ncbi:MAG: ATP-dependent zinc metalloprotease FtsH [Patescibacteria group bacterium]
MKIFTKNLLYAVLVFAVISALFSFLRAPAETIEEVALSRLATQVNEGAVKEITVEGSDLRVVLKDDKKENAKKENEASLTESLKNYGVDAEKLRAVNITMKEPSGALFWIGAMLPFLLPFVLVGVLIWFMFRQAQKGSLQAFSFSKTKARLAGKGERVTFSDVAGLKEAKEELHEIIDFLKNPKKFLDIGAKIPRGVLLMGPPGTGKTLLARAVAGEAEVPFFHISGSEFVEMFVGVGASRVRDTFTTAKQNSPSILFIDELDAIGRHRGAGLGGGHDEREQTLNQILVEMDGFERETNVIVMAATNRPDILDPALLRPGRFDRRVILDEPDINDREQILKIHALTKPLAKDVKLRQVAERTPGFSGADLANIMNEGAILAARRNKTIVSQTELLESIEKVLLGPERKSHILSSKEKEITAYHEAGHAVVAAMLPGTDPVHKVSIIARGRAAGYTLKLPMEDKHLHTRTEFLNDLSVMLAGYAAEQEVFHELTTGASNDLQKVTELARRLVTQFGMSEKLGPMTFGHQEELVFLGKEIHESRNYSEAVAFEIDKEIRQHIHDAHLVAQNVIKANRHKLDVIAKRLIEKETIEKDEFAALMKE